MTRPPRGLYGPNRDGLGDPDRFTLAERATRSDDRLQIERDRRRSWSPLIRALQAATDRALGKAEAWK
jgi:hypothetical protein